MHIYHAFIRSPILIPVTAIALSAAITVATNAAPLYPDGVGSVQPGPQIATLPPANPALAPDRMTPQPDPSIRTPQELSAGHDVSYAGWMTEEVRSDVDGSENANACVYRRPVRMRIERDSVTIWYVNWGGNTIHYHGKVGTAGRIEAWHMNGDRTRSVLTGQITNNGFAGYMLRGIGNERCAYGLTMREETAASGSAVH